MKLTQLCKKAGEHLNEANGFSLSWLPPSTFPEIERALDEVFHEALRWNSLDLETRLWQCPAREVDATPALQKALRVLSKSKTQAKSLYGRQHFSGVRTQLTNTIDAAEQIAHAVATELAIEIEQKPETPTFSLRRLIRQLIPQLKHIRMLFTLDTDLHRENVRVLSEWIGAFGRASVDAVAAHAPSAALIDLEKTWNEEYNAHGGFDYLEKGLLDWAELAAFCLTLDVECNFAAQRFSEVQHAEEDAGSAEPVSNPLFGRPPASSTINPLSLIEVCENVSAWLTELAQLPTNERRQTEIGKIHAALESWPAMIAAVKNSQRCATLASDALMNARRTLQKAKKYALSFERHSKSSAALTQIRASIKALDGIIPLIKVEAGLESASNLGHSTHPHLFAPAARSHGATVLSALS